MSSWTEFLVRRGATFDGDAVTCFPAPEEELAAARDAAVVCDLAPLAAMRVAGPDAAAFLQGQLTSDVAALAVGTAQYSAWCSPKGRMLANFILLQTEATTFELLLPVSMMAAVRKRLTMFVLRSKLTIEDTSGESVRIGVGGPTAAGALRAASVDAPARFQLGMLDGGLIVAVPGGRYIALMQPALAEQFWDRVSNGARPAGFPVWQWLTIRAGVPIITAATTDRLVPQMANWDALDGVSFRKGCYTGSARFSPMSRGLLRDRARSSTARRLAINPAARSLMPRQLLAAAAILLRHCKSRQRKATMFESGPRKVLRSSCCRCRIRSATHHRARHRAHHPGPRILGAARRESFAGSFLHLLSDCCIARCRRTHRARRCHGRTGERVRGQRPPFVRAK